VAGKEVVDSKGIYTLMITQLIPQGLIGVLVAALLSGLMSQISGALNSISTIVSYDIYKRYNPETKDARLVKVGKIAAGVSLLLSLALLPLLNHYGSIFDGLNDIIAHIAPPITCVFLLGVFWEKASAVSAKYTLWIGSIGQVPFMMMAFYLFVICVVIQVTLSYLYPVKHTKESATLYWKSPWEPLRGPAWSGLGNYKVLSLLLVFIMVVLFYIFR